MKLDLKLTAAVLVGAAALVALGILALSYRQSSEEGRFATAGAPQREAAQFVSIQPPRPLPSLDLTDEAGKPASLAAFEGKVVLVNFWATWCAPCVKGLPALSKLQARLSDSGFAVVTVAADRKGPEAVKPFLEKHGVANLAVLYDPRMAAARALGVTGLPASILLDRKGREIGRVLGTLDWGEAPAMQAIRQALGLPKAPSS